MAHSPRMGSGAADAYDILIVGAGQSGAQAAIALRQQQFTGTIALLGAERELPYERPPLSKDYLSGEKSFERILIRPAAFWMERAVTTLPGRRVVCVDPAEHEVTLADGARIRYGRLIWATGGSPRQLKCAGHDLRGVHTVRTRAGVDLIKNELTSAGRIVVVGGGYIGLETAAVLTTLGKRVTVVEATSRVLSRVAGEPVSRFYESIHRTHGVDVRLDAHVAHIEGKDGRISGVRLVDGELLPADMLIVGIGIVPDVEPLLVKGAEGGDGVDVDAQCRTSLIDIFAIGDCARHANPHAGGRRIRLESIQNANDQASLVAKVLTGGAERYSAVPRFWSNQYDVRLQTVGLPTTHDDLIVRANPATRGFSVIYLREERVIALDCVNASADFIAGGSLVAGAVRVERRALEDAEVPLKAWATKPSSMSALP